MQFQRFAAAAPSKERLQLRDIERSVVARRMAGLGDLILSLAAAWRHARATRRTLVIDWRFTAYTRTPQENLFPLLFTVPESLLGVPVAVPEAGEAFALTQTFAPASWSACSEAAPVPLDAEREAAQGAWGVALIERGGDVTENHIVFAGCLAPAIPDASTMAALLRELDPVAPIRASHEAALARIRASGRPIIGLHVRHGNGGPIMGHHRYWSDGRAFHRIEAALARVRRHLGSEATVLLATDSLEVQRLLTHVVRNVVTYDKRFRLPGEGDLHRWREAPATREDALVEMLLLASTDVLLRFPPNSYFSAIGAYLKAPAPADLLQRDPPDLEPGIW